jgi:tetratricopeptide (TPR) repeat protein
VAVLTGHELATKVITRWLILLTMFLAAASTAFSDDKADKYFTQGNAKAAKGDFKGAIKDFTKAIALKPDFAGAYVHRGLAKQSKGDTEGTFEDLGKAIKVAPDFAEAYGVRGLAKVAQRGTEKAYRPKQVDVVEYQRRKPRYILCLDRKPFTLKLLQGSVHVKRIPEHDYVDNEAESAELACPSLYRCRSSPRLPWKNRSAQLVPFLSPVQLDQRPAALGFVIYIRRDKASA